MAFGQDRLGIGVAESLAGRTLAVKAQDWRTALDSLASQLAIPLVAAVPPTPCDLEMEGEAPLVLEQVAMLAESRWGVYRGCLFLQPERTQGIVALNGPAVDVEGLSAEIAEWHDLRPRYVFFASLTDQQLDSASEGMPLAISELSDGQRHDLLEAVRQKKETASLSDAELANRLVLPYIWVEYRVHWRGQIVYDRLPASAPLERYIQLLLFGEDEPEPFLEQVAGVQLPAQTAVLEGGCYGVPLMLEILGLKASCDPGLGGAQLYVTAGRWDVQSLLAVVQQVLHARLVQTSEGCVLSWVEACRQVRSQVRRAEVIWRAVQRVIRPLAASPASELGPVPSVAVCTPRLLPWALLPERWCSAKLPWPTLGASLFAERPLEAECALLPVFMAKILTQPDDPKPVEIGAGLPGSYAWLYLRTRLLGEKPGQYEDG